MVWTLDGGQEHPLLGQDNGEALALSLWLVHSQELVHLLVAVLDTVQVELVLAQHEDAMRELELVDEDHAESFCLGLT